MLLNKPVTVEQLDSKKFCKKLETEICVALLKLLKINVNDWEINISYNKPDKVAMCPKKYKDWVEGIHVKIIEDDNEYYLGIALELYTIESCGTKSGNCTKYYNINEYIEKEKPLMQVLKDACKFYKTVFIVE